MCILFLAINQHPKYPVIICANRDEFHQRPTKAMHWWADSDVLAGQDLQAGGTWLGLNKQGRFSALTNFRQPHLINENKKSRGDLVLHALAKSTSAMNTQLAKSAQLYNGFNLVYGQLDSLHCFDSVSQKQQPLTTGFHSLCNGALDDIWPKMALGQATLSKAIKSPSLDIEQLFELMKNSQQAHTESLPNTGVPLNWEQLLSSIFIVSPDYGTRTTNIITLEQKGKIAVYDRSYDAQGQCIAAQNFSL